MKKLITLFAIFCLALTSCTGGTESGFLLNLKAEAGGTIPGQSSLSGRYPEGTRFELTANPNPGYSFYRWLICSSDYETLQTYHQNPVNLTMPPYEVIVVATFRKSSELFYLDIVCEAGGSVPLASLIVGNYLQGEAIGLRVRNDPGWVFEKLVVYSSDYEVLETIE